MKVKGLTDLGCKVIPDGARRVEFNHNLMQRCLVKEIHALEMMIWIYSKNMCTLLSQHPRDYFKCMVIKA